jgi:cytochrome P450
MTPLLLVGLSLPLPLPLPLSLCVLFLFVSVVVVVLFLVLVRESLFDHLHFRGQGLSCAPFIPVFGHLPSLFRYESEDRNLEYWKEHVRLYGPIHAISLGIATSLKLNDPHYLKPFFRTMNQHYQPSLIARMYLEQHVGHENLLLSEGAVWSRHRRTLNPAFHHSKLQSMVGLMARETARAMEEWCVRGEGGTPFDFHEALTCLTFNVIAACAFGADFAAVLPSTSIGGIPTPPTSRHSRMRWIAEQTQWRAINLVGVLPVLRSLPLWGKPEMERLKAEMFALVDAVVRERKGREREEVEGGGDLDLLDLLLQARDPETGVGLTDTEVRDEAMTFVLAGHETTSSALSTAVYALMSRPRLWADCLREVEAVCGDEPPLASHLSQLPLLEAVLWESLRLYPPVPIISKDVAVDHWISTGDPSLGKPDLHLRKGQHLHVDVHVLHRLPQYWGPTADQWDHTRWMRSTKPYTHPTAFTPFSIGTRSCIGQQFAIMEAKVD